MLVEEEMPGAEGKMKQFASWFTHGVPNGSMLRQAVHHAKNASEIVDNVEQFFEKQLSVASGQLPVTNDARVVTT